MALNSYQDIEPVVQHPDRSYPKGLRASKGAAGHGLCVLSISVQ